MKRLIICLPALVLLLLCGCTGVREFEENGEIPMTELNERQIEICEEMLLPTTYEELEEHQKTAIVRIEQLLSYLDEKYGKTFSYSGYAPDSVLDDEWLMAYSDDMHMYKPTTLRVLKDGSFSDNHIQCCVELSLESELYVYALQNENIKAKLFVSDCQTDTIQMEKFALDATENTYVFITVVLEGDVADSDIEKYCSELADYVKGFNIGGHMNVFCLDSGAFEEITIANYKHIRSDYKTDIKYQMSFKCEG